MLVKDVYEALERLAPFDTQMGFDNAGLLIGSMNKQVQRIGVVLDVTSQVLDQAIEQGIDCIVSHHPIIFSGLKSIDENSVVYRAIANGVTVISAHTNLDAAQGGVNDVLCESLGLSNVEGLAIPGEPTPALGRVGELCEELSASDFAQKVNQVLNTRVKYVDLPKTIRKVAVCGGSGADFMMLAVAAGADALVTSEVKHHQFLEAQAIGFVMIDAGHFETENPVVARLCDYIKEQVAENASVTILAQKSPVCYA